MRRLFRAFISHPALPWAKDHPGPAAALIGAGLYASLRITHVVFYAELGTTPEEVGLGYIEVLSLAPLTIPSVLFASLSVFLVGSVVVGVVMGAGAAIAESYGQGMEVVGRIYMWALFLLVPVSLAAAIFVLGSQAADAVRNGTPDMFNQSAGLGIRIEPVEVVWVADSKMPESIESVELALLGANSQQVILYDAARGRTLRLPATSVVLVGRDW